MTPEIRKYIDSEERYIEEDCYIKELSNSESDEELSIARARVAPGVTTRWHRLQNIAERYYIIEGEGIVEIGELEPQRVVAGDVVLIPPNCRQRIHNPARSDLIFLALCTPRFKVSAYQQLE
jgi:mannose-6-phosphate isomerase-like protein (cupin superfamily)